MHLHDRVVDAAEGRLPEWAEAGPERRAHIVRVVTLLDGWGRSLGLDERDLARWRAAGWLHDALREADPELLRPQVPEEMRALPGAALHGPAAAARLRAEGVEDEPLLDAVAYHTVGHPALDTLGRALYAADFLEPGRTLLPEWRAGLRSRMPEELEAVTREILGARVCHLVERGSRLQPSTVAFWNALACAHAPRARV